MKKNPKKKEPDCKLRKIYGLRVVREYLQAKPEEILTLHLLSLAGGSEVEKLAKQKNISVRYESPSFFSDLTREGAHQGIAVSLKTYSYVSLSTILEKEADMLLFLEEIVDPRNLGALLRTAEAAGVGGVVLTKNRTASLSAVVEKAAVGATAYLPICRVENIARALDKAKEEGYWIVGLSPNASVSLYESNFPEKIVILLGGEEKGLRVLTRAKCDFLVALPMQGHIQSLNVSVAGATVLYEFLRRRLKNTEGNRFLSAM